jgi:subtilase family serine protease
MANSGNELVGRRAKPLTGFPNELDRNWGDRLILIAPDLRLELPQDWITPTPPTNGQAATIHFRIRNIGQKPALDFTTYLFMDGVHVGSWVFHHIDEKEDPAHQYRPLYSGQATETFEYVTSPLKGTHTLRWVVDAENEVPEQSEANNIFDTLITAVSKQHLPDLTAKVIEPTGPVEIGQGATLKVKVTNQGQTDVVHPFWVFVKSNGLNIITQEISTLKAYESIILERPIKSVGQKTDRIDVEVDVYNEISESNKNNNSYTTHLEFTAVDLEVANGRLSLHFRTTAGRLFHSIYATKGHSMLPGHFQSTFTRSDAAQPHRLT